MSDFYQTGVVTTLRRLGPPNVERLERELVRERPVALVLPSLFSELEGPALGHIVDELSKVPYVQQIVISLDRADRKQFERAREFFSRSWSSRGHRTSRLRYRLVRPGDARTSRFSSGQP